MRFWKFTIDKVSGVSECKTCGRPILWVVTPRGKKYPVDLRGIIRESKEQLYGPRHFDKGFCMSKEDRRAEGLAKMRKSVAGIIPRRST